jgi:hypothetical protein
LFRSLLHEQVTGRRQKLEPLGTRDVAAQSLSPLGPEVRIILPPDEERGMIEPS